MTLVIAALVEATYRDLRIPIRDHMGNLNYCVYGDDIIVRQEAYEDVVTVIRSVGFILNDDKSFSRGMFRESCGKDFHSGYPVRPAYLETLSSVQDLFSIYNRLMRWSAKHQFWLWSTFDVIVSAIPRRDRYYVPPFEDDCAGFHTSDPTLQNGLLGISLRQHLGVNIGSFSYRCWRPKRRAYPLWEYEHANEEVHLLEVLWPDDQTRSAVFYGESVPGYLEHFGTYKGFTSVRKLSVKRELYDNPDGVLTCILGGYVTGTGVLVRTGDDERYEISHWLITPSWRAAPGDPRFGGWHPTYHAWKAWVDVAQAVLLI